MSSYLMMIFPDLSIRRVSPLLAPVNMKTQSASLPPPTDMLTSPAMGLVTLSHLKDFSLPLREFFFRAVIIDLQSGCKISDQWKGIIFSPILAYHGSSHQISKLHGCIVHCRVFRFHDLRRACLIRQDRVEINQCAIRPTQNCFPKCLLVVAQVPFHHTPSYH
jgi:hypothetical protein